jgi:lipopolysaccharide exporter
LTASAIGQSGVSAVKWSAVSTALRFALQLGAQVVLARTLGPEVFGIFAIGMVVLTFANFVSGFGFSWSLLQRSEVSNEDVRFAWTWQCLVGLITMVALYFLAPYLAAYFREPRAEPVIAWLSIACLLNAAAGPATYLLQRDLNFRAVGLVQVASYALGYVAVGVPLALMGWGTTALVAAWLVQALAQFVASYALKPHAVKPLFWYLGASTAMGTGRAVFLTNIVNWVLNNLDRILIARLLNATSLGLYNVAYNLATLPNALLLGALQPAFLAAGARLQNEVQRLASAYLQMLATILVLGVPAFVFLGLISPDIVQFLYGAKWTSAGWVLGILFFAMPAYVVWGISTPILWNTQRKNHEFALQLPLIGVGLIAFYYLAGLGIHYAAAVAAGLLVLRAVVIGTAAFRALGIGLNAVLPDAARGAVLALICAAGVLTGQHFVASFAQPALSLAAAGLVTLLLLAAILLWRPQLLGQHTLSMIVRFIPALKTRFSLQVRIAGVDTLGEQRP